MELLLDTCWVIGITELLAGFTSTVANSTAPVMMLFFLVDTLQSRLHLWGARAGESYEIRTSADIPDRSWSFVR